MSNGAQILLKFLFGHADAVILNGQDAVLLIAGDEDAEIALVHAHRRIGQALIIELIDGIRCVGDQLAQENFLIGVDGVDHHIHQLFAFSLKFFLSHNAKPLFICIRHQALGIGYYF